MAKITGEQKLFALLSYLGILVLIPLLVKKDDKYINGHAKQGLMLLIYWVAAWVLFMIPLIGWFVLGPLAYLFCTVLGIIGIVYSLIGKTWELPFFGKYAAKWKI